MSLGHVEESPTPDHALMEGYHAPTRVGYDPHNPRLRALIWFGVWFVVVIAVVLVLTWLVYRGIVAHFETVGGETPQSALAELRPPPPEPRLQPSPTHDQLPQADVRQMLEQENAEFERRGWQIDDRTRQPIIPQQLVKAIAQQSAAGVVQPNAQPSIPAAPNIAPAGPSAQPARQQR